MNADSIDPASVRWWTCWSKSTRFREAILSVHCRHLVAVIDRWLSANRAANRRPSRWKHLYEEFQRNPGNVFRFLKSGEYPLASPDVAVLASILGMSPGDLFPEIVAWLSDATESLLGTVGRQDAEAYVRYMMASPAAANGRLDQRAFDRLCSQQSGLDPAALEASVETVIRTFNDRIAKWKKERR